MMTIPIAAALGFIVQEAMAVIPAIKKNENSPKKFSFGYYFTDPANVVSLVLNAAASAGLVLAHAEITLLMVKVPVVGEYFDGVTMPILTGLLIGFGGSWVFRWLASKMA